MQKMWSYYYVSCCNEKQYRQHKTQFRQHLTLPIYKEAFSHVINGRNQRPREDNLEVDEELKVCVCMCVRARVFMHACVHECVCWLPVTAPLTAHSDSSVSSTIAINLFNFLFVCFVEALSYTLVFSICMKIMIRRYTHVGNRVDFVKQS